MKIGKFFRNLFGIKKEKYITKKYRLVEIKPRGRNGGRPKGTKARTRPEWFYPNGRLVKGYRYEYEGHKRTIKQWSKITGLKEGTITYRLVRGWSIKEALSTAVNVDAYSRFYKHNVEIPTQPIKLPIKKEFPPYFYPDGTLRRAYQYEFNGMKQGLKAWEKTTGIQEGTIASRLRKGWSIEQALTKSTNRE